MATKKQPAKGTLAWELQQQAKKRDSGWDKNWKDPEKEYHVGIAKVTKDRKVAEQFNLLRAAEKSAKEQRVVTERVRANVAQLVEGTDIKPEALVESVINLLAHIAMKAADGQRINLMHQNSIAAFLAGVETIANALPTATDETKKENTLRALALAGLASDGMINDATFPIVNLGARKPALHKQWADKLRAGDGQQIAQDVRRLQMSIDRAMRTAAPIRSMARTAPSVQGTSSHA